MTVNYEERRHAIVAALDQGEPVTAIAKRFEISEARVYQIAPRGNGSTSPARPTRCGKCDQRLEQRTDGNGNVVDYCPTHGADFAVPRSLKSPSPEKPTATVKRPRRSYAPRTAKRKPARAKAKRLTRCKVEGCPGILNDAGDCACCEKRDAYEREHFPRCEICEGSIDKGTFCAACKPIARRVEARTNKSKAAE